MVGSKKNRMWVSSYVDWCLNNLCFITFNFLNEIEYFYKITFFKFNLKWKPTFQETITFLNIFFHFSCNLVIMTSNKINLTLKINIKVFSNDCLETFLLNSVWFFIFSATNQIVRKYFHEKTQVAKILRF